VSSILSPLIDFLICLAKFATALLLSGITLLVNATVAVLMALLTPLLNLLPTVTLPTLNPPSFLAWANYLFPLDQVAIAGGLVVTVLLAWPAVAVGLRWLKVVP